MDIYGWDAAESALQGYVSAVAEALGVPPESTCAMTGRPASAYIALEERLPNFPDRDLALLWEDTQGWAAAIETHSGEDVIVVAYLGGEVVPPAREVVAFLRDLLADRHPGQLEPPNFDRCPDLVERLARHGHRGPSRSMVSGSPS
ncbi:hypothetical protein FHX82_003111 [Amycolatopsis bartoniae]|uniref:DUF6292 domain-containing protein n=1 Tax=Amycolatopsis bartoniae TaxID=941986 RepID=A0A8H9J1G1_9PSEU|nr:DUF6292 family protein [Amycolatopsis bartoniae]MBB2936057.1 hypothetical protein [Amycolatopsis bartoniae]GHF63820.1 hypothetical protein GCM10017566_41870 [Amycolatopsis bartoniae]